MHSAGCVLRAQEKPECCQGVLPAPQLQTCPPGDSGVTLSISLSLLATDKGHHPESLVKLGGPGEGQKAEGRIALNAQLCWELSD